MSEPTEREAILREIAKKKVVYRGMEGLPVRPNLTYRSTSGAGLPMAIYYPASPPGRRVPIVIVGDGGHLRHGPDRAALRHRASIPRGRRRSDGSDQGPGTRRWR